VWHDRDMHVLIVEDEDSIAQPLAEGLRQEGYTVDRVATGGDALTAHGPADVVLLDLRLPDMDGLDVCRRLRAESDVPVIIVSARGDEIDRVLGLEIGADDYVVKPFGFREVLARIRAVSRRGRSRSAEPDGLVVGPLHVDPRSHRVTLAGEPLDVTPKEFDLLALLASEPGVAISRQRMLEHVWKTSWYGSTKTIDVHVASLRRKLGDARWIETVRGVGFRLQEPA
jgi:two-component system, OmpR family, response regulator RegX3